MSTFLSIHFFRSLISLVGGRQSSPYARAPSRSFIFVQTMTTPERAPVCHGLLSKILSHHVLLSACRPIKNNNVASLFAGSVQTLTSSSCPQCSSINSRYRSSMASHICLFPRPLSIVMRVCLFASPLSEYQRSHSCDVTYSCTPSSLRPLACSSIFSGWDGSSRLSRPISFCIRCFLAVVRMSVRDPSFTSFSIELMKLLSSSSPSDESSENERSRVVPAR
mmetsp:Transcript_17795/g.39437  ORF Transcript_17795/g.39437 Transcript_17795/m.39437 type:complete len:222 (-) Transcript_17795:86-751(-)